MLEVTKPKFFEIIGPLNVHPRIESDISYWERTDTREIVGRSERGRTNRYWLADRYTHATQEPST